MSEAKRSAASRAGENMRVPAVSIGLPTYNRAELLAGVLDNFRRQTFEDFELIVSDNASPDPEVARLCEALASEDPRIRYVRHDKDIGMMGNFWFVYRQARAPYFMWASDDDVWPRDFIARGVAALERERSFDAWFCQVVNINSAGDVIRTYPSNTRFNSSRSKLRDLVRFLWEPEVMAKCLLLYALYRRNALEGVVGALQSWPYTWGLDNAVAYGFLCRHAIVIEDDIALGKRIHTQAKTYRVDDPRSAVYPWSEAPIYFKSLLAAARGTGYAPLTAAVLAVRWLYDRLYHERIKLVIRLRRVGLLPRATEPG
jgi:glycosyltransferase involved in cell wall biosynthesis